MADAASQTEQRRIPPQPAGYWLYRFIQRPQTLLIATFGALIGLGTVLLALPAAQAAEPVGLLDVLFTATSAVCVTGLITVDTATAWTPFGHVVILGLMQIGALGVMTFAAIAAEILRVRLSFGSRAALRDTYIIGRVREGIGYSLGRIVALTFALELAGTGLLYVSMLQADVEARVFDAAFLAVSAFCNAGFSIYTESVIPLKAQWLAVLTLITLITLGGFGYPVLFEIGARLAARLRGRRPRSVRWSLHTRIVLWASLLLVSGGALALLLVDARGLGDTWPARIAAALFQSVTARTAGFNTVVIGGLALPALLIFIPLMFIGAAPGSPAGGIKITAATAWGARVLARLRGRDDVTVLGRRLPLDLVRRAGLIIALSAGWNLLGVLLLTVAQGPETPFGLEDFLFEQVSAFGTVGLSTGLTPHLTAPAKAWIIASMFVGRVGPLTVTLMVITSSRQTYRYPVERVIMG